MDANDWLIKKQAGNQKVVGLKSVARCAVSLTTATLRSFDRVDLDIRDLDFDFTVGRKVAETGGPFFERRGCLDADRPDGAFNDVVATFAHFDDVLAAIALKNATAFTPESTFCTGKNCLTLHRVLLYLTRVLVSERGFLPPFGGRCQPKKP